MRKSWILLSLLLLFGLAPHLPAQQESNGREELYFCGELSRGSGLASGEHGIVDRFNNAWHPSKALVRAQQERRSPQSGDCGGFRIDFEDVISGTGVGFDDRTPIEHPLLGSTTLGALRQRTLCEVFGYIGSVLDLKGSPDVIVRASQTDGSGFLAAASPFFLDARAGSFIGGAMFDHITTGVDPTPEPGNYDAMIIFDFGPWVIGGVEHPINDDWSAPAAGRLDLFSIALHEATHTLGFLSLIASGGGSGLGGAFSRFDRGIHAADGSPLVDPNTAIYVGSSSAAVSNTLVYHGRNCDLASPIYSPNPYRPGSSMSHFDSYRSATRYVMRPATGGGEDRAYTEEELQALCDMGYALRNGACGSCAPRSTGDTASTLSGIEVCVDVLANDVDPGGGVLAIADGSVTLLAGAGDVIVRGREICFTPPADFTGLATIVYTATNGSRSGEPTRLYVHVTRDRSNDRGLDSGLVAWWSFNDSTAADASGNGNHGAMNGAPAAAPGVCGAAMSFDGIDDYIRVPNSPSLHSLKRMTLSYWLKYHCTEGVGNTIGNGSDDLPRQRGFYTYHGSSDLSHFLGLQPDGRGLRMPYDATVPLDLQQYIHVVFVVTDDSLKLYRNGCLVGTTSRQGWPIARDWDWFIGWSGDFAGDGKFLEGMLDEIRIYDRVLGHDEILQLYAMCGGAWGVTAEPALVDIGTVRCPRRDSTVTLRLRNPSDRPLDVHGSVSIGTDFHLIGSGDLRLDPAGSAEIMIRFAPTTKGDFVDTLLLDAGACGGLLHVPLIGAGAPCADSIPERGTDLLLSKIAQEGEFYPGDTTLYRMSIRNAGPRPDTAVVVNELLPAGLSILSYTLDGAPATFDIATRRLMIPILAVGDSVLMAVAVRIGEEAVGTPLNCIEVAQSQQGELDPLLGKACAPITVHPCPRIVGAVTVLGESHAPPGSHIVRGIELTEYDSIPSQHLRITMRFDSAFMQIDGRRSIPEMVRGTLLEGWLITRVRQGRGELVLDFRTGGTYALRQPGRLLNPEFLLYLGERLEGVVEVEVSLLDRNCTGLTVDPAGMRVDSVCGLSFRLMEISATKYALHPATPNPFNPTTVIDFSLGLDGPVRLEVFNSTGDHVETLVDNTLAAGAYSVMWDASAMPSGLYYCRLDAGHWIRTMRLLLVK